MYVECAIEARSFKQFCLWNYKYYIFRVCLYPLLSSA